MAIPALNEDGLLPEGIHDCAPEEAKARFGSFQKSDRRPRLWARLEEFLLEVRACGLVEAVVLNGSFVTGKPELNAIDLILVVRADHDFSVDLAPAEYNVLSKRRVVQRHRFDLLVARAGAEEFRRYVSFFQQVRLEVGKRKGILRLAV